MPQCPHCGVRQDCPHEEGGSWGPYYQSTCCRCLGGGHMLLGQCIFPQGCATEPYEEECDARGGYGLTHCGEADCAEEEDLGPCCMWKEGLDRFDTCAMSANRYEPECCQGRFASSVFKRGIPMPGRECYYRIPGVGDNCDPDSDPGCITCTSCPGEELGIFYASCCECPEGCHNFQGTELEIAGWEAWCRTNGLYFELCKQCHERNKPCDESIACCHELPCDPIAGKCCTVPCEDSENCDDPAIGVNYVEYDCYNASHVCCKKREDRPLGLGSNCETDADRCCADYSDQSRCCLCHWCCDMPKSECDDLGGFRDEVTKTRCEWGWAALDCPGEDVDTKCERAWWKVARWPFDDYHKTVSHKPLRMWDSDPVHKPQRGYVTKEGQYHKGFTCGWSDHVTPVPSLKEVNYCLVYTQDAEGSLTDSGVREGYSVFGCGYQCVCPARPCEMN